MPGIMRVLPLTMSVAAGIVAEAVFVRLLPGNPDLFLAAQLALIPGGSDKLLYVHQLCSVGLQSLNTE